MRTKLLLIYIFLIIFLGVINMSAAIETKNDSNYKLTFLIGSGLVSEYDDVKITSISSESGIGNYSDNYKVKIGFLYAILNFIPTNPVVDLIPYTIYPTSLITCNITTNATDRDNDSIIYYYKINNSYGTTLLDWNSSVNSVICTSTNCYVDTIIYCNVYAYDGEDKSDIITDSAITVFSGYIGKPPTGTGTGTRFIRECELNISPKNVYFNFNKLIGEISIYNFGDNVLDVGIKINKIPTVFGLKDLLLVDKISFIINSKEYRKINISLKDISKIREKVNTSIYIDVLDICHEEIMVNIDEVPSTFFDVGISTNHLFYTKGEIADISITLKNKGVIPNKDSLLNIYTLDDNFKKNYISKEILYEVDIGTTKFIRRFLISDEMNIGKHIIGVEYETEEQGLLRSESEFYVIPIKRSILFVSSILILTMIFVMIFIWFLGGEEGFE